ncbi:MAG: putative ribosomal N-acetyltransferase YdaF [bacterium ADurb.Bin429]|nr:MAG: putative ribosomal N-acetyltransferase YdaF [bacterium ADurb.Bin429]
MLRYTLTDDADLIELGDEHAEELFALVARNRAHLRAWLPWVDDTRTVETIDAFIARMRREQADTGNPTMVLRLRGQLAGVIGIHPINWNDRKTSLGYWLSAEYQGRGLMTRACRTMVNYALVEERLNRVEITAATGNGRSRAIPERLGFTHEGCLRQAQWLYDHFVDLELYAMLREEWAG